MSDPKYINEWIAAAIRDILLLEGHDTWDVDDICNAIGGI
jgi:hypothetical protein